MTRLCCLAGTPPVIASHAPDSSASTDQNSPPSRFAKLLVEKRAAVGVSSPTAGYMCDGCYPAQIVCHLSRDGAYGLRVGLRLLDLPAVESPPPVARRRRHGLRLMVLACRCRQVYKCKLYRCRTPSHSQKTSTHQSSKPLFFKNNITINLPTWHSTENGPTPSLPTPTPTPTPTPSTTSSAS